MEKLRGWRSSRRRDRGIREETQSQAPGDGLGCGGPRGRAEMLRSSRPVHRGQAGKAKANRSQTSAPLIPSGLPGVPLSYSGSSHSPHQK